MFTGRAPRIGVKMALKIRKWPFPLSSGMFSVQLENDFQRPLENEAGRHFQMFSIFTLYGGTAPLKIGGRPGP
jgi:hypothetical protein